MTEPNTLPRIVATTVAAERVSRSAVRRFVEAHEMAAPQFASSFSVGPDESGEVNVPWSALPMLSMPSYWRPGDAPLADAVLPPLPWDAAGIQAEESMTNRFDLEFHEPLRLDDLVTTTYSLASVVPKRTRVGEGSFLNFELEFRREDGTLLATERTSVFTYTPAPAATAGVATEPPVFVPRPAAPFGPATGVGDSLGHLSQPLTRQRVIMVAAATRDFAPAHIDDDAARAGGAPAAYMDVMYVMAMFERLLTEWAGPTARLRRLGPIHLHDFVACGPDVQVCGEVSRLDRSDPHLDVEVEVEMAMFQSDGRRPATCTASIRLPQEGGR